MKRFLKISALAVGVVTFMAVPVQAMRSNLFSILHKLSATIVRIHVNHAVFYILVGFL